MKIERFEVQGHRDLAPVDWRPADLTVLEGAARTALAEAVFTLASVPRGWSDLGQFYGALDLPPRSHPSSGEAHTTRWRLTCAPRGDALDGLSTEYELGIYPPAGELSWEIRYEFLRRFDDFNEVSVLSREGASGRYELSKLPRGAPPRRAGRETFAGDIPVLGARQELFDDPAVRPFAQPLALWSWYRGFDVTPGSDARADRAFPGFHERLIEGGGNLINALLNLHDLEQTRPGLHDLARAAVPGFEGLQFGRGDKGEVTFALRVSGRELRPADLEAEALRALCAAAAVSATDPPPLCWFEPQTWAGVPPEALPRFADRLLRLSARAHVVLAEPPPALVEAVAEARGAAELPEAWRSERIRVEFGPPEGAWESGAMHPLTALSTAP
ncbi:MAG: hypothetical protein R3A48_24455 [Polyangiales bacterium]